MKIITLTTDFGLSDSYVAQMKGVILSEEPNYNIVDISHQIPAQNILEGAIVLKEAAEQFPKESTHIAVVDPGVGSKRRALLIKTHNGKTFIGPDNGLLSLAAKKEDRKEVWEISIPDDSSNTFHGRDVFGKAAVGNAKLKETEQEIIEIEIPAPMIKGDEISGEIIRFDSFGNAISNIKLEKAPSKVLLKDRELELVENYDSITSEIAALIGSQGYLEISSKNTSTKESLKVGDKIVTVKRDASI